MPAKSTHTKPSQMRLGDDVLTMLDDLVADARAVNGTASRSSVVRAMVIRTHAKRKTPKRNPK